MLDRLCSWHPSQWVITSYYCTVHKTLQFSLLLDLYVLLFPGIQKKHASDGRVFQNNMCACWCTVWAEIFIRGPSGNVAWMMRIENDPSHTSMQVNRKVSKNNEKKDKCRDCHFKKIGHMLSNQLCVCLLFYIFIWIFWLYGDVNIAGEGLQDLRLWLSFLTMSRNGSFSYYTCCDIGLRFLRSYLKDCPNFFTFYSNQRVLRISPS